MALYEHKNRIPDTIVDNKIKLKGKNTTTTNKQIISTPKYKCNLFLLVLIEFHVSEVSEIESLLVEIARK